VNILDDKLKAVTLHQMMIFLFAAKYENFNDVAEKMYLSQASVSRNIASLERDLGLVLFKRYRKRVYLSETGTMIANDWQRIL
jgi:DNA-binding transcriptional LysR family regulator